MATNKLSKFSVDLHRLIYTYIRNMPWWLFISHCLFHMAPLYGSPIWGHNFDTVSKLQKKVVKTISNSV